LIQPRHDGGLCNPRFLQINHPGCAESAALICQHARHKPVTGNSPNAVDIPFFLFYNIFVENQSVFALFSKNIPLNSGKKRRLNYL
jgi:hypothetical protein